MKYYTVYRIKNKITGKFYIGAHVTENLNDGYMGSGVYLKRAQKKYGIEKFEKETLDILSSEKDMYARERELVKISEETYNIMLGGQGGWSYARSKITNESYKKVSKTLSEKEYSEEDLKRFSDHARKYLHTPESRIKSASSLKIKMNEIEWKKTIGVQRSKKISETLTGTKYSEERNNKVKDAMTGRICITVDGKKRRVLPSDPILEREDIIFGWKN
jgi:hypothetical protein